MLTCKLMLFFKYTNASYIFKRYSKASNKYLTSYDPKKPTRYTIYLDKNNLYDYAMSNSLGEFYKI